MVNSLFSSCHDFFPNDLYHLGNIDDLIQSDFSDAQPEIFQGRGGFVKLGTPINISSNIPEKKAPQGKILKFIL